MASTANSSECNFLRSHTLPNPYIFSSERAKLAHIKERISSLDRHISELNVLRHTLDYRSSELHNLFSPIRILPIDILSRIFQQVVAFPEDEAYSRRLYCHYHQCLSQAFTLASVSTHFRHVALGTPELWRRVPLTLNDRRSIHRTSSLLQHCTALAASVSVSVVDRLYEEETPSAIKALLTLGTMQKIKALDLECSAFASKAWIMKLSDPSFTMLDTLSIQLKHPRSGTMDLRAIKTVTRLNIYCSYPRRGESLTIIPPPSLQYLTADDVAPQTLVALLSQCPNLVECTASVLIYTLHDAAKALTLHHLKRLKLRNTSAIMTFSSQKLRLPSFETLQIEYYEGDPFSGVILLCRNVSSTLTTLEIYVGVHRKTFKHDDVYRLWKISFPNLRVLELGSSYGEPVSSVVQALALRANKRWNPKPHYLPSLVALTFNCQSRIEPRCLLDLLAKWKVGKASDFFDFYVEVKTSYQDPQDLSLDVREELRSIVGSRRIEFTWYVSGTKVLQLSRTRTADG